MIVSFAKYQGAGNDFIFAILKEGKLHTRTFERGVEDETLACGSGAAAVIEGRCETYFRPSLRQSNFSLPWKF